MAGSNKVSTDIASKVDVTCRKGDTFEITLTFTDSSGTAIPLVTNGYQFLAQVRRRRSQSGINGLVLGTSNLGVQPDNLFEEFSIDDNGSAVWSATAATMRAVPAGRFVYDIQHIVDGVHTTVLRGTFTVNDDIAEATA
jgi:hypothetical protein